MKVFISWSGELSHRVALILRDWLPNVIQSLEPWVSSEDIQKGVQWGAALSKELEADSTGILCLTRENINSQWLHFEAGALVKTFSDTRVIPFVFQMKRSEVSSPLMQFQNTLYEQGNPKNRDETWKLMTSINDARIPPCVPEPKLKVAFDKWWPDLESALSLLVAEAEEFLGPESKPKPTNTSEVLEEILELARDQQRMLASVTRNQRMLFPPIPSAFRALPEPLQMGLMMLPDRERKVLELRYGLSTGHELTMEEVASEFGISSTRVEEIHASALRRLLDTDPTVFKARGSNSVSETYQKMRQAVVEMTIRESEGSSE